MENGFGANDIITGRGLGIGGFGYGGYGMNLGTGNSVLAASAHADGTGIGKMVECNGNAQAAQLDRLSGQNEETRRIIQNDETRKDIADFRLQNAILDGQNNVALCDRFATLSAANAKCCCDTQLLVVKENSATRELVVKENSETRELVNARALQDTQRDLDRCLQEKQTQTIIATCCPPCPHPTCL